MFSYYHKKQLIYTELSINCRDIIYHKHRMSFLSLFKSILILIVDLIVVTFLFYTIIYIYSNIFTPYLRVEGLENASGTTASSTSTTSNVIKLPPSEPIAPTKPVVNITVDISDVQYYSLVALLKDLERRDPTLSNPFVLDSIGLLGIVDPEYTRILGDNGMLVRDKLVKLMNLIQTTSPKVIPPFQVLKYSDVSFGMNKS